MEVVIFEKNNVDDVTNVKDTLRVTFSAVAGGLNEIKFVRLSTNSRDPKEYKFYFTDDEMFDFEETINIYNEGLNRG